MAATTRPDCRPSGNQLGITSSHASRHELGIVSTR